MARQKQLVHASSFFALNGYFYWENKTPRNKPFATNGQTKNKQFMGAFSLPLNGYFYWENRNPSKKKPWNKWPDKKITFFFGLEWIFLLGE